MIMAGLPRGKKVVYLLIGGLAMLLLIMQIASFFGQNDAGPKVESGLIDLSDWDFEEDGNLRLDGEWEFYWDQLYLYEDILGGRPPDLYGYVPSTWNNYIIKGKQLPGHGHGTYRIRVKTNVDPGTEMGFQIMTFSSAYKIFINEEEIAANGVVAAKFDQSHPELKPQSIVFTLPANEFDVIVQVSNYHHGRGGFWYSVILGSSEGIAKLNSNSVNKQFFFTGTLIFAALTYICLYVLRHKSTEYLYLALLTLVLIVVIDVTNHFLVLRIFPQISYHLLIAMWYGSASWVVTLLVVFTEKLFPARFSKQITRFIVGYACVVTLLYVFAPVSFYTGIVGVLNVIGFVQLLFVMYLTVQAVAREEEGSMLYLFGFVAAIFVYSHDTLFFNNIIRSQAGELGYVGIALLIFVQVVIQAQRYTRSYNENLVLLDKLRIVNQGKEEFLYNTSHEIQSPLIALTTLAEELLSGTNGELNIRQMDSISRIKAFGGKASNLVNDILDYTILKRGELSFNIDIVNVRIIAESVLKVFDQITKERQIRFENEIPEDLFVYADENRLYQIIYNLVDSALKLAPQSFVKVLACASGDFIKVSVQNNGEGIHPDNLGGMFDFFEDDVLALKQIDGSALGLPITKQLISLQGGELRAENTVGVGTIFYFTLPMAKKDHSRKGGFLSPVLDELTLVDSYFHVPGSGPHILVLDNIDKLNATTSILGHSGYAVTAVGGGEKGVDLAINDSTISVVLLDLMILGKSGYDICREIRQYKSALDLPILILTARVAIRDIVRGFDAGANDYLSKPFEKEELLARVRTLAKLKESVDKAISSEILFLQAQIKPHFLFNALSIIASLTASNPKEARRLIIDLSEYLRNSFDFTGTDGMNSLVKEIETVNAYVAIEKARFGSRLDFQLVTDCIYDINIPRLILQPLVENSIRHGIFMTTNGGFVHLHVEQRKNRIHFSIVDNGVGMAKLQVDNLFSGTGAGVGLGNINKRLLRYYGSGLTVSSIPGQGTTVAFSIPWQAT